MDAVNENTPVPGSSGATCVTMFTSPLATLNSLRDRPQWFMALLVAGAYSVLVNFYVVQRAGLERLMTKLLKSAPLIDPQGVLQSALLHQNRIVLIQALATFVGAFVIAFVVARVLWLLLIVAGKDVVFKRVFAVVAHATLLTTVIRESALALTVTLVRDLDKLDLRNPLATNPGFFVHPASPTASRILTWLDLITLTNIFLLVVGLTKVCDGLSRRVAAALVVVPWLAWVGASLLLASLA
jgi:hypothetical protein